jgi:hypothetical protein
LQKADKKLDLMDPAELTLGMVKDWVESAIRTEREMAGLTEKAPGEREGHGGKQLEIQFTSEFEGL